ncbi:MAG: hypothetical protein HZB85_09865 [Deltaproteobacteria bacterium]|nr:hypothetical protein [Deltaproteobacteria bacterium]
MDSDRTTAQPSRTNALKLRFNENGLEAFTGPEAIKLLLGYAGVKDASGAATRLTQAGAGRGLRALFDAPEEALVAGAGGSGALLVKVVKALGALYLKERLIGREISAQPGPLRDYLILTLGSERVEKFVAVFLDAASNAMGVEVLHVGTINQTAVYPRVCVEAAIRRRAAGLIFAHNHPSGDPTTSAQDRLLMGHLDRAADAVGLTVYDHLIVGRGKVFSFRDEGGWRMERQSETEKTRVPQPRKRKDRP